MLADLLRSVLESYWAGTAEVFADVDSRIALAFIQRYPTPDAAVLTCLLAGAECPGVDQLDTTALVVAGVAGRHRGFTGADDRGDLAIELADRPARCATFCSDGGACPRGEQPRRAVVLLRPPW